MSAFSQSVLFVLSESIFSYSQNLFYDQDFLKSLPAFLLLLLLIEQCNYQEKLITCYGRSPGHPTT